MSDAEKFAANRDVSYHRGAFFCSERKPVERVELKRREAARARSNEVPES